ncbi:MAG: hypothetical protein OXU20_17885 [Myxococcales bacterium]|nr:hypothetical protein [Myxococcales bacterium]
MMTESRVGRGWRSLSGLATLLAFLQGCAKADPLTAGALWHNLKGRSDRGAMMFDFVDYLDAVRCRSRGPSSGSFAIDRPLRRLLIERSYPYDFKPDISCP